FGGSDFPAGRAGILCGLDLWPQRCRSRLVGLRPASDVVAIFVECGPLCDAGLDERGGPYLAIDPSPGSNFDDNRVQHRFAWAHDSARALLARHGERPAANAREWHLAVLGPAPLEQDRLLPFCERRYVDDPGQGFPFVANPRGVACST